MNSEFLFLKSALADSECVNSIDNIRLWVNQIRSSTKVSVSHVPFEKLDKWYFDKSIGNLRHESGKFFSIDGIEVSTNWEGGLNWNQPIINQPEVGILGFLTKEINGVLHFLVQAKIEPGNVNIVQLSPTLQATRSNFSQVHGGKKPDFLEYFQNVKNEDILLDQLQSEQGGRFLRKRNRNIIIRCHEEVHIPENFKWLTLSQLKFFLREDNAVNMDTRTVLSGITFGNLSKDHFDLFKFMVSKENDSRELKFLQSYSLNSGAYHDLGTILSFLTRLKSEYSLNVLQKPLGNLKDWLIKDEVIEHKEKKYFSIIGVDIEIEGREVKSWSQPIVKPSAEGICAFISKEINGIVHFAVQAKLECGNTDVIEFAPTIQALTDKEKIGPHNKNIPFLDYVMSASKEMVLFDSLQSEEGGRFYQEQNRNMIILADDSFPIELPERWIWMTLSQISMFLKFNNYLNVQARSLIACLPLV